MSAARGSRRLMVLVLLMLTLAAGGVFAFYEAERRAVVRVRVAGDLRHTPREALERAVAAYATTSLYRVDVESVRNAALNQVWVKDASVRRVWPDSVHIAVIERAPVARWGDSGLLEDDASVFYPPSPDLFSELSRLEGPPGSERTVLERYRQWQTMLDSVERRVVHLRLDERGAWRVDLDNDVVLLIGQPEATAALGRFVQVFEEVLRASVSDLEQVDLRYDNGFAVRWKRKPLAPAAEEQG